MASTPEQRRAQNKRYYEARIASGNGYKYGISVSKYYQKNKEKKCAKERARFAYKMEVRRLMACLL